MSTASHNWSKVLMGERSHPPCEGWQGNVAGGNGFSQSAETEGRSLGGRLAARHRPFTPTLPVFPVGAGTQRRSLCLCLSVFRGAASVAPKRRQCLIIILGLS